MKQMKKDAYKYIYARVVHIRLLNLFQAYKNECTNFLPACSPVTHHVHCFPPEVSEESLNLLKALPGSLCHIGTQA